MIAVDDCCARLDEGARGGDNAGRPGEAFWIRAIIKSVGFVHLHVHSSYSLREGALTIETLAKLAKADEMPALAITDTNNLFGALEFSEKLAKSGVQAIIGAQITVDFADAPATSNPRADQRLARAPIVLLAQNEAGYLNLMRLASPGLARAAAMPTSRMSASTRSAMSTA